MANHLDLLRTIHLPLSTDGCAIKNAFGVTIATALDPITAHAIAELANLGRAGAEEQNRKYEDQQRRAARLRTRKNQK